MKTKQTYSVEFKEQALSKVLQRGNRTVGAVADELNVNILTLRNWMRGTAAANRSSSSGHARRPEDWSLEERLMALQESHGLADEALNGWCRERGDDQFHAQPASCTEPVEPGFQGERAKSGLVWRHHLYRD
ncbi:transposase [Paraburkholderia xenovorans]